LILLNRVTKPVKVLTCQVDVAGVNPKLLDIADKTGGSLHTLEDDVANPVDLLWFNYFITH
jgi:hypothetical protein